MTVRLILILFVAAARPRRYFPGALAAALLLMTVANAPAQLTVTVGPGTEQIVFQNPGPNRPATDFRISLVTGPLITDSNGGLDFPQEMSKTGTLVVLAGPPGIKEMGKITPDGFGDKYTHVFAGFPAGTMFDISFSYENDPVFL